MFDVMDDDVVRTESSSDDLVATVVLSFSSDPFVRWLFPNPLQFLTSFTDVTRLHGERTSAHGGAYCRGDGRGAAFWYPPDAHPDGEALAAIFAAAGIADRVGAVWDAIGQHEPPEPHWYLRQIGVDPALHGRGAGGVLLQAALSEIDLLGQIAYLEATSVRGVAFYERHGFRARAEVSVDGSPPLWPMLRPPQATRSANTT